MVRSSPIKNSTQSQGRPYQVHSAPKRAKLGHDTKENHSDRLPPSTTKSQVVCHSTGNFHHLSDDLHPVVANGDLGCSAYHASAFLDVSSPHHHYVEGNGASRSDLPRKASFNPTQLASKTPSKPVYHTNAPRSSSHSYKVFQAPNSCSLLPNSSLGIGTERACMKSSMRNFSKMVCQKLEEVNVTSYNEISENLIQEFTLIDSRTDHKNVRRRVYDVLNVLHSIGVIEKDKRQIRWIGFPAEIGNGVEKLENEKLALERRIQEKKKGIQMCLQRFVALNRLIQRNKNFEYQPATMDCAGCMNAVNTPQDKLLLPFILISAPKDCRIDCEMLEDRTQYFFEFDMPFAIHEDMEVLKMLGLDKVTRHQLLSFVNPSLAKYYPEWLLI